MDTTPIIQMLETASPAWWLTVIGSSLLLIWAMELDSWKGTVAVCLVACVGLILFGDTSAYLKILLSLPLLLTGLGIYLAVGVVWAICRWMVFVWDRLREYANEKREWLASKGIQGVVEIPSGLKDEWAGYLRSGDWVRKIWDSTAGTYKLDLSIVPKLWDHASRATLWGTFWPWSLVQTIGRLALGLLWKWLLRWVAERIDRIIARFFKVPDDLA